VPKGREIGQGIVIALTQRNFDVVVCDRTIDPAIAERFTTNAAPCARLSSEMISPIPVMFPASAMQYSLPGHIECLVNNAGLSAKSLGDLSDVSAESYELNF
jgi:NAD(P)-dependent dehydrogenase (short-subunit alcohol dehydrogenase family)